MISESQISLYHRNFHQNLFRKYTRFTRILPVSFLFVTAGRPGYGQFKNWIMNLDLIFRVSLNRILPIRFLVIERSGLYPLLIPIPAKIFPFLKRCSRMTPPAFYVSIKNRVLLSPNYPPDNQGILFRNSSNFSLPIKIRSPFIFLSVLSAYRKILKKSDPADNNETSMVRKSQNNIILTKKLFSRSDDILSGTLLESLIFFNRTFSYIFGTVREHVKSPVDRNRSRFPILPGIIQPGIYDELVSSLNSKILVGIPDFGRAEFLKLIRTGRLFSLPVSSDILVAPHHGSVLFTNRKICRFFPADDRMGLQEPVYIPPGPRPLQTTRHPDLSFADTRKFEKLIEEVKKTVQHVKTATESELMVIRKNSLENRVSESEVHQISNKVMSMIDRRIAIERERRGYV